MSPASPHCLELHAGALRLALRPDLGGAIAGLWHADTPVLRSSEPALLASSRQAGCYPLVPYSNRLGFRRFRWLGQEHSTAQNFDSNPHSVHGVAWQRPWQVLNSNDADATLSYHHAPDEHWPFAFEIAQQFGLSADQLTVRLVFTNLHATAQPVGLGWHPYFPKRGRSHVEAAVSDRWEADAATELPTQRVPQQGIAGDVAQLDFNHCFDGWQGAARIQDEQLSLQLRSSLTHLVVYTPRDKPYFCVEPVSHVSNALQMPDPLGQGLQSVPTGGRAEAFMQLSVAAL